MLQSISSVNYKYITYPLLPLLPSHAVSNPEPAFQQTPLSEFTAQKALAKGCDPQQCSPTKLAGFSIS